MKHLFVLLMLCGVCGATCSGSGTSWTCTAATTPAQVNTVIGSATDGALVTFASGAYTWNAQMTFALAKGLTLSCPSGPCTVTISGTAFGWPTGSSTKLYRITGFAFTGSGFGWIWTCPAGGCTGTLSQVRIDHNSFNDTGSGDSIIQIGENTAKQYAYGVIDHNTVTCSSSCIFLNWIDATDAAPPTPPLGLSGNIFLEDNTITIANLTDNGTGCTDGWGQMAEVSRHNTVVDCRLLTHGVTHGGGPSNIEDYNNDITMDANSGIEEDCFRCIHHQGSNTFIAFSNTLHSVLTPNASSIVFQHYCSFLNCIDSGLSECDGTQGIDGNRAPTATWKGYPCFRQPGRDTTGAYKPMYFWNNTANGSRQDVNYDGGGSNPDLSTFHIVQDREYFVGGITAQTTTSSPFNGTTGMGFGTLAKRPATCTTSSETALGNGAGGVGYFATDVGPQGTGGGTLYTCSASNTWAQYWVEYQYPHPLEGFSTYPTFSPGAGSYSSSQTVTIANPNASGVVCYTTDGTTPITNGDGATCSHGTAFTAASSNVTVSATQTLKAISGTSTVADSQVNQQPFTISGSGSSPVAPSLGLFADLQ